MLYVLAGIALGLLLGLVLPSAFRRNGRLMCRSRCWPRWARRSRRPLTAAGAFRAGRLWPRFRGRTAGRRAGLHRRPAGCAAVSGSRGMVWRTYICRYWEIKG